jgi:hypothetical protein
VIYSRSGMVAGAQDSSVTRSDAEFARLFKEASLRVGKTAMQTDFPAGMFAIKMYELHPDDEPGANELVG